MKKYPPRHIVEFFAIALSAFCILIASYFLVKAYTIEQVEKRVRDTMLECRAFHEYVQNDMHPEYYKLMQNGRLPMGFYAPQMLSSSYIARSIQQHYNKMRSDEGLPEIKYKMAAENPRNPINQADSIEISLIRMFNSNRTVNHYHKVISEQGKRYLLSAKPFLEVKSRCLKCHGRPEDAPQDLKKEYNWTGGFNLKVGDIVAVEMVRSPLEGEFSGIILSTIFIAIGLVIVVILLVFNARLRSLVRKKVAEAQQTIAAERERLFVSLRSIGDGVITVDVEGKIDIVNRVAEALTGWKQADARGKPFEDVFKIVNRETRLPCENPVTKILSSGEIIELEDDTVLIASDGTERIIADSGAPIRDSKSVIIGVVLVFRDVTEKTKYQETYNRTAKLDSLAVLAGGIAHDFNNLLGGIYGYTDMAREESDIAEVKRYLDMSIGTIDRARGLTQQLLTFSKGGVPVKKIQPLFPFVEENARFSLC